MSVCAFSRWGSARDSMQRSLGNGRNVEGLHSTMLASNRIHSTRMRLTRGLHRGFRMTLHGACVRSMNRQEVRTGSRLMGFLRKSCTAPCKHGRGKVRLTCASLTHLHPRNSPSCGRLKFLSAYCQA